MDKFIVNIIHRPEMVLVLRPLPKSLHQYGQGGALVDLRPYVAKLEWPVGIGMKHVTDASYPFLIQEKYRAGLTNE